MFVVGKGVLLEGWYFDNEELEGTEWYWILENEFRGLAETLMEKLYIVVAFTSYWSEFAAPKENRSAVFEITENTYM